MYVQVSQQDYDKLKVQQGAIEIQCLMPNFAKVCVVFGGSIFYV